MKRKTNETSKKTWYALRRTLVSRDIDRSLAELIEYCRDVQIDEVILVLDTEEFSHNQPSKEWVDSYQPQLFKIRDALTEAGILYSLNPWVTVGHNDRGRDIRSSFPGMRMMVGHHGETAKAQSCPLDSLWRNYVAYVWGKYAETEPHVIWVDDDARTFNHQPVDYGCFCKEHLRLFSNRIGCSVSREELVSAIFQEGEPHPWRGEWLGLQRDLTTETFQFLRRTVQTVSPKTRMGLMSSGPENHVLDGRDWTMLHRAFAGENKMYSRPPLGNYWEVSLRGFYYSARQIRATRYCLPETVIEQTEVENWWFSRYSKSVTFTEIQIGISLLLGSDGLTLNLYDHMGTSLNENPGFGEMLRKRKPFFSGISSRCRGKAPCGGVRILHHDDNGKLKKLSKTDSFEQKYEALTEDGYYWDSFLESLGFATTWDDSSVTAVSGQVLRAFSNREIENFLQGGVLLDLGALEVLMERGFGEWTGVDLLEVKARNSWENLAVEEWHNRAFGGDEGKYLTMTIPFLATSPDVGRLELRPGAMSVSQLLDIERKPIAPMLTVFENPAGGRIAVFPIRLMDEHGSLLNPLRKAQFSSLMSWVSRGKIPLEVNVGDGASPLPVRRDFRDHTVVGVYNLSLDSWQGVEFYLQTEGRIVEKIEMLDSRGRWVRTNTAVEKSNHTLSLSINKKILFTEPLILDIVWKKEQKDSKS